MRYYYAPIEVESILLFIIQSSAVLTTTNQHRHYAFFEYLQLKRNKMTIDL